jgi:hypothetical protein
MNPRRWWNWRGPEWAKFLLLLGLSLAGAAVQAIVHLPAGGFNLVPHRLNWREIAALGKTPVLLVDAREGELRGAPVGTTRIVRLAEAAWEDGLRGFIDAWTPDTRVVVLCDSPAARAAEAIRRRLMREFGLADVFVASDPVPR